ncbi:hypothetical protein [Paraburkholderia susongensis]|nr:hypothetical protein [Paraburkholderia susongensis]
MKRLFSRMLPRKIVTNERCDYPLANTAISELANAQYLFVKPAPG